MYESTVMSPKDVLIEAESMYGSTVMSPKDVLIEAESRKLEYPYV